MQLVIATCLINKFRDILTCVVLYAIYDIQITLKNWKFKK